MKVLLKEELMEKVKNKASLFRELLTNDKIISIRSAGLLIAVEFDSFETNKQVIDYCVAKGVLTDWFLFAPDCLRIAPPLTISKKEIKKACGVINDGIASIS